MAAKGVHHVSITASDFDRSKEFYDALFAAIGAQEAMGGTGAPHPAEDGRWVLYAGDGFMYGLWSATADLAGQSYSMYAPGFHHAAFAAPSREEVDALHTKLQEMGANILNAPAEYPYVPGYYAVYFTDPDGLKLEPVHIPG